MAWQAMEGRGGVVVNVASQAGLWTVPITPVYAATKAGVVHFSRSMVMARKTHGVRVHALCPGFADTPLVADAKDVLEPLGVCLRRVFLFLSLLFICGFVPVSRAGGLLTAEEVAEASMRLVTDDSIAGKALVVDKKFGAYITEYDPEALKPQSKL